MGFIFVDLTKIMAKIFLTSKVFSLRGFFSGLENVFIKN